MKEEQPKKPGGRPKMNEAEKRRKPDISLSKEVIAAGKDHAKACGMSFSAFAESAIREKLAACPVQPLRPLRQSRTVNPNRGNTDRA
jgi:hypothetical protein